MAVILKTGNEKYIGLSTDSKPTGVKAGSTFIETNTLTIFLYSGSAWIDVTTISKISI